MRHLEDDRRLKMRRTFAVISVLFAGVAALSVQAAEDPAPCTIAVEPGDCIQEAIDGAPEGAVICLAEGTWQANLEISKTLTLRGRGAATAIRSESDDLPVLWVDASQGREEEVIVVLADLHLTGGTERGGHGILVTGTAQATITGCIITDNVMGIVLLDYGRAEIRESLVSENELGGIVAVHSTQATIADCELVENTAAGIVLEHETRVTLTGNTIIGNTKDDGAFGFGVMLVEPPCHGDERFSGHVAGAGNQIPGPGEDDGNQTAAFCPEGLDFLTGDEGGALDRRD